MVDERIQELINKAVDGTITTAEQVMLEEYRAGNPEVAELLEETRYLSTLLGSVQPAAPPVGLKAAVMREIEASARPAPSRQKRSWFLGGIRELVAAPMFPRMAYAFAGGIALGMILLVAIVSRESIPTVNERELTGTIVPGLDLSRLERGAEFAITTPKLQGAIQTQISSPVTLMNLRLTASEPVITKITFDPGAVAVKGVRKGDAPDEVLTILPGVVEVKSTGTDDYTLVFASHAAAVQQARVSMYIGGSLVYEKNVTLVAQGSR
jgi:hypothetical protein